MTVPWLAGVATPVAAVAGHDRPELRATMQSFVDAGLTGVQPRMRDTSMPGTSPETPGPQAHAHYRYDGKTHDGSVQGYGTVMYSTLDGGTTLTGSLNYVDDADGSMAVPFFTGLQRLVDDVFC